MLSTIWGPCRQNCIVEIIVETLFLFMESWKYTHKKSCWSTVAQNFMFIKKFELTAITAAWVPSFSWVKIPNDKLLLLNVQWRENKWLIQFLLYLHMFCLVNISEIANYKMNYNVQASSLWYSMKHRTLHNATPHCRHLFFVSTG